ncbi:MAG: response regulator transcription factor [Gammaproteobacteria bacterium]|nr:response regulator transcription factor [Gammaproteobacteria bacterium]
MRILLVEDDTEAANYLVKGLTESGHVVEHAADGDKGLHLATENAYDSMIIDRMLPKRDGLSLIEELRKSGNNTPVLILSALDDVDERVTGLKAGGDDYLTKPYSLSELTARLQALSRRAQSGTSGTVLRVGDLSLDLIKHKVTRGGENINLQPREFRLLEYLMQHTGQVVTRSMLLENVWDYHFDPQTNVIDVQISRLRSKIDKDFDSPLLHTVRGAGYKLQEESRNVDAN